MTRLGTLLVACVLACSASCVTMSASMMISPTLSLAFPAGRVQDGEGQVGDDATKRMQARGHAALAVATRDALAAAAAAPDDVRLQRRAAAMVRAVAADEEARAQLAALAPAAQRTLDHLVAVAPCPGLADAAATYLALGDASKSGDAYVEAARRCDSVEAAIAAVRPLRSVDRCDDALEVLRAAWPHVQGATGELGIAVLDGVASCSSAITLRRNLAFVPPDVVEDYFALLEARRIQAAEAERRAEQYRQEQEAASRAFAASSRCESECSAAVSSCETSCSGNAACSQRCSALGHACRSGCSSY